MDTWRKRLRGGLVALVLTAVNILVGYVAGQAWRYSNYRVTAIKVLSMAAFAFCVFLAFTWNIVAGHVRDVYVLAEASGALDTPDQAFAIAFAKLLEKSITLG